jgi:hypothetical protein
MTRGSSTPPRPSRGYRRSTLKPPDCYTSRMGTSGRIGAVVRNTLIIAAKTVPVVVVIDATGCGQDDGCVAYTTPETGVGGSGGFSGGAGGIRFGSGGNRGNGGSGGAGGTGSGGRPSDGGRDAPVSDARTHTGHGSSDASPDAQSKADATAHDASKDGG